MTETHCATVFFVGDQAFKIKKPLDLGFVDFSTPEARRKACHREVELNRQFAPDVYLGVAEVNGPDGKPCEWIVTMRRMPVDRRLAALVETGEDLDEPLRAVARMLAAHHASARRSDAIDRAGSAAALRARWVDNLTAVESFCGDVVDEDAVVEIRERALRYVDGRGPLLAARVAAGRIRDGHGDLLANDIFCLPDGPRVLDCLEFDAALRAVDGIDDAACLAMDLERLGAATAAARFLDWFVEFSGRPRVPSLEHHYVAYRAVMRAKVACLRSAQGDPDSATEARLLLQLGLDHLRAGEPMLILVGGAPGVGKSTVAGGLADAWGAVLLSSDRLRKERAGLAPGQDGSAPWRAGLYAPTQTEATYDALLERAGELLARGESVVLDASWAEAATRAAVRKVASANGSRIVELRCVAPATVCATRIRQRAGTGDPSDATPEIAERLAAEFADWSEAVEVPTDQPRGSALAVALRAVGAAG